MNALRTPTGGAALSGVFWCSCVFRRVSPPVVCVRGWARRRGPGLEQRLDGDGTYVVKEVHVAAFQDGKRLPPRLCALPIVRMVVLQRALNLDRPPSRPCRLQCAHGRILPRRVSLGAAQGRLPQLALYLQHGAGLLRARHFAGAATDSSRECVVGVQGRDRGVHSTHTHMRLAGVPIRGRGGR